MHSIVFYPLSLMDKNTSHDPLKHVLDPTPSSIPFSAWRRASLLPLLPCSDDLPALEIKLQVILGHSPQGLSLLLQDRRNLTILD